MKLLGLSVGRFGGDARKSETSLSKSAPQRLGRTSVRRASDFQLRSRMCFAPGSEDGEVGKVGYE